MGQEEGRRRCRQHGECEDDPATVTAGPDAEDEPSQRAREDWRADEKAKLSFVKA